MRLPLTFGIQLLKTVFCIPQTLRNFEINISDLKKNLICFRILESYMN